ncbi:tyrosine-type recombinase/integrase [Weissella minor]|uniref:Integrase n=1 Tax=Weissella minor TaxID=1620 RepID=A0A0R2JJM4_9LACO|nr:tyrosine-type recombinase/integrase [Weissella minor]KRN77459.1 integrase [Weissella minor]
MASISKVGSTYKVRVSIRDGDNYRRKTKSGFKTKSAAKAWAIEQESLKNTSGLSIGADQLFSNYFEAWYKLYKTDITEASLKWYRHTHRLLVEYLPNVTLEKLSRPILQDFFNQLGTKNAYSTNQKVRMYIRSSLQNAIYDGLIYRDATQGVVITGKDGKSKDLKFLETKQMADVIQLIQSIPIAERTISDEMILTGLYTGARYQEIAALTLSDIKPGLISINKAWEQFEKKIKETKTKTSNRIVDVPVQFTNELMDWGKSSNKHSFIFSKNGKTPVTSAAPNKRLHEILREINSPKQISFHGLRHTHASWLLSQGVDTQYVSERLGHSSVTITLEVYTHLLQNKRETESQKSVNLLKKLE